VLPAPQRRAPVTVGRRRRRSTPPRPLKRLGMYGHKLAPPARGQHYQTQRHGSQRTTISAKAKACTDVIASGEEAVHIKTDYPETQRRRTHSLLSTVIVTGACTWMCTVRPPSASCSACCAGANAAPTSTDGLDAGFATAAAATGLPRARQCVRGEDANLGGSRLGGGGSRGLGSRGRLSWRRVALGERGRSLGGEGDAHAGGAAGSLGDLGVDFGLFFGQGLERGRLGVGRLARHLDGRNCSAVGGLHLCTRQRLLERRI